MKNYYHSAWDHIGIEEHVRRAEAKLLLPPHSLEYANPIPADRLEDVVGHVGPRTGTSHYYLLRKHDGE